MGEERRRETGKHTKNRGAETEKRKRDKRGKERVGEERLAERTERG